MNRNQWLLLGGVAFVIAYELTRNRLLWMSQMELNDTITDFLDATIIQESYDLEFIDIVNEGLGEDLGD